MPGKVPSLRNCLVEGLVNIWYHVDACLTGSNNLKSSNRENLKVSHNVSMSMEGRPRRI